MRDFQELKDIMPTELINDQELLLEYMNAALQTCLTGQELQVELRDALSREESYQSIIAEQTSQIQKLTEKNASLNESDIILKNNEKLTEENKMLKARLEDAERNCSLKISDYKKICDNKMQNMREEKQAYHQKYKALKQKNEFLFRSRSIYKRLMISFSVLSLVLAVASVLIFNVFRKSVKDSSVDGTGSISKSGAETSARTEERRTEADTASSAMIYDYATISEITALQSNLQEGHENPLPVFPEAFSNGYVFAGGEKIMLRIADKNGIVNETWNDVEACYTDESNNIIAIREAYYPFDNAAESPTELRTINNTTVRFDLYEYLHLPCEGWMLIGAFIESLKTDDHFFVIYDADFPHNAFFSRISFEKDGINYEVYSRGNPDREILFSMAAELL